MDAFQPPGDYVSYGGRFRVRWTTGRTRGDTVVFLPRLLDARTGAVLLDLWDEAELVTGSVVRADGPVIRLSLCGFGTAGWQGDLELDADAGTYRTAHRAGSFAPVRARLAAGFRDAGAIEAATRPLPAGPPDPDGFRRTPDVVTVDGRFRVEWHVESEGHGATWDQPKLVDQRTGRVLLDLHGPDAYGFRGEVVRAADPVVELLVAKLFGGGACNVVVDAAAGTFEVRNLRPPGATHDVLRGFLRRRGLREVDGAGQGDGGVRPPHS